MDVSLLFLVMSCLNLTVAEFFEHDTDNVDVVDPTGWDYNRVTKGSHRYDCIIDPSGWNYDRVSECLQSATSENDVDNLACENLLSKCREDIAYFQLRNVAAMPDPSSNSSSEDANNSSSVFIKRFINLLLDSASLLDDKKSTSGDIEIIISPAQLKRLSDYSSSRINMSLRELDSILSNIIHKKPLVTNSFYWNDMIYSLIVQKEVWLYVSMLCIVVTFCRISFTVRTVGGFARLAIFAIFILAYLIEYFKMYKAVEIRQRAYLQSHPDVPDACNPKKQNWFYNLFEGVFSFKKDECERYYKELWAEPFMEVSPLSVLSSILADFVLYPTDKIGHAIVVFSKAILGGLPLQYGWFIYLMSCFGMFIILVMSLILLFGGSMRLGGLLGGLEVSQNRRQISSAPNNDQPEHSAIQSGQTTTDNQNSQRKTSVSNKHLLLEAVGKTDSFVLMDANSLQTILKNSLIQHRNEIEEIARSSDANASTRQPKKIVNGSVSSEGSHLPLKSDSSSNSVPEYNLIDFNNEVAVFTPDKSSLKSSSIDSDDLFSVFDSVESISSEVEAVFGTPESVEKEITAVA